MVIFKIIYLVGALIMFIYLARDTFDIISENTSEFMAIVCLGTLLWPVALIGIIHVRIQYHLFMKKMNEDRDGLGVE